MTRPTDNWKNIERKVAAIIGGVRVPVTGRSRGDAPDIAHERLAIEVKAWAKVPASLREPMAQARAAVRGTAVPLVVLHQAGDRAGDALCLFRLEDLARLMGETEE
ncbi:MAG: hypothetical protein H0W29_07030 [Gemmatimonadales bacterium]|nr:hypothetical protein [Gemmatimonadales bacterium]